ncbi:peroxiredoxin-like family protein [Mycolicibacterium smegmatis]|nr:peroxiredoxin-like family protein [Mycolicibacterium smegmatis]ABK73704.1 conserved hypothetical protein [Mycolicibacterium smegmatis MC2 155]AIU07761.1 alkyl hydroperoxide reductase [Mycolicibacterium smegmatis MC2 155]AIU14386.1 alkyl hydroperoxide reductase [Mycolicibacterium smegmatis]AIU21009.1 alkyl hydroperoxide reductase [Mycolicibacterium smegmatis]AWT53517.1 hypothetical protein D806_025380 [Mycolicibacterium smegmatis MKD8]
MAPPTTINASEFHSVTGKLVRVPDPDRLVHLQFRRFAGCPICNLHLRSFVARHDELERASIREVVFFHSPADELARHTADLPFATVGDPDKVVYRRFGVEQGARALLDPRSWPSIVRGVALTTAGRFRTPSLRQPGGRLGLPADFLIAPDGTVAAAKYGRHADDQWSVDEVLHHAAQLG